jgi:hypothetical protein
MLVLPEPLSSWSWVAFRGTIARVRRSRIDADNPPVGIHTQIPEVADPARTFADIRARHIGALLGIGVCAGEHDETQGLAAQRPRIEHAVRTIVRQLMTPEAEKSNDAETSP